MSTLQWLLVVAGAVAVVYGAFVGGLVLAGRRGAARALAGFVPDCIGLVRRLMGDPRVSRHHKLLLGAVLGYLALPFDLVPDFVPIAGQLDDAIVVAVGLRAILRASGPALLSEHWHGPLPGLSVVLRFAGRPSS